MCLRAILICLLILFDDYDDIFAIMYSPFESFCILEPFREKRAFWSFLTLCVILILNLIHAHIMICDECLCDIILLYVPRRSFIALFALFLQKLVLRGFEHRKSIFLILVS